MFEGVGVPFKKVEQVQVSTCNDEAGEGGTQHVGEISRGTRDKRTRAQHQRVLAPAASAPHMRGAVLLVGGHDTHGARRTRPQNRPSMRARAPMLAQRDTTGPGADADESPARLHPRAGRVAGGGGGVRPRGGAGVGNTREGLRFEYFFYSLFRRASSAASTYP